MSLQPLSDTSTSGEGRQDRAVNAKRDSSRVELAAAELYLGTLMHYAPARSLLDVRYRTRGGYVARFFLAAHSRDAARTLVRIGRHADVYVGVAARVRSRGTRRDIAPTALIWVDCDTPAAVAALDAFSPPASMIVSSGQGAHGYWALTRAMEVDQLERANRRLAVTLGGDQRCADAARILRVPGSQNFKYQPPRPVRLQRHSAARYRPLEILSVLAADPCAPVPRDTRTRSSQQRATDPLQAIRPAVYVQRLTGRTPGRDHKILCPLHEERTPSFHVYPSAERGWTCYGCPTPDGRPLRGDIYTLAGRLWGIPTAGRDFLRLRERLDELFLELRVSDRELYTVHVSDKLNADLAGHTGRCYDSPPQSERQARELIAVVLDVPEPPAGKGPWWCAHAGGSRQIALRAIPRS